MTVIYDQKPIYLYNLYLIVSLSVKLSIIILQKLIKINKQSLRITQTKMLNSQQSLQQKPLKYEINYLLSLFNEFDSDNQGFITYGELQRILIKIGINLNNLISLNLEQTMNRFQFDDMLHYIGLIQVQQQPSIYVIAFIKTLAQYRNKCIQRNDKDDKGLIQAKQIGDRIKLISKNQVARRKQKLLKQHQKIYDEMNRTQNNQFHSFETEWKKYLSEFRTQTHERIEKVKNQKIKQLTFQSNKLVKTTRRYSLVTSPKLRQLLQKKKWLVKQGKYAEAIQINYIIENEKKKIEDQKDQSLDHTLKKRVQSMKKKNQSALNYIETTMNMNMNKLLSKKKQGEHLMQIRMKNLRQEAEKKLNDHLRSELMRLKGLLSKAAR